MAGCVILSIGAALQCSAYGIPQLIVGRIIAGVGNGLNTSTIREFLLYQDHVYLKTTDNSLFPAVWHSELSKAASRGKGVCYL